LITEKIATATQ